KHPRVNTRQKGKTLASRRAAMRAAESLARLHQTSKRLPIQRPYFTNRPRTGKTIFDLFFRHEVPIEQDVRRGILAAAVVFRATSDSDRKVRQPATPEPRPTEFPPACDRRSWHGEIPASVPQS